MIRSNYLGVSLPLKDKAEGPSRLVVIATRFFYKQKKLIEKSSDNGSIPHAGLAQNSNVPFIGGEIVA